MRKIGQVTRKTEAENFEALALAKGIRITFREGSDPAAREVWVQDDSKVAEAKDLLQRFLSGEKVDGLDEAMRRGAALKKQKEALDAQYKRRIQLARKRARAANGTGQVATVIIGISAVIGVLSGLGSNIGRIAFLLLSEQPVQFHLPEIMAGQVWRLITPAFLHFGILHLLFNLYMFYWLGRLVEVRKGARFFLLFFLTAAVASNLAQYGWYLWKQPMAPPLFGGLSGVLYALLGYVWIKGRIDPGDRIGIDRANLLFLLAWLVLGFTGAAGPIANFAHLGGLVWGMIYAPLDVAWFEISKRR